VYHNNHKQTVSPLSSLLMTVLPFSLLDGDDNLSVTHPFSGFRFCVINHVSAPKLLSLISVTCQMDTRKAHTIPYSELCHHLQDSLAPSMHKLLCNPVGPGQFCALPSQRLALWHQQLNVSTPCIACSGHAWCPGQYLSTSVLSLLKAMPSYLPVCIVLHILHTP